MIARMTGVTKKYKNLTALDNFSLSVNAGEVLGLLGPNGAGKSTAIRVLCGLASPNSGEVELFGAPVKGQALRQKKRIGLVPQDLAIYETLSARENLLYFGRLYGLSGKPLKDKADEVLRLLGLHDVAGKAAKKYSGGMKRRLNIGCAIMHSPELLILDEPTVGVDPQSRNHILEFVERSAAAGTTVIYTSHYMEEVERVSGRVAVMDAGRVIAEGAPAELSRSLAKEEKLTVTLERDAPELARQARGVAGVLFVEMEGRTLRAVFEPGTSATSRVLELCLPHGVLGVASYTPTLEDAFLSLTGKTLRDE